MLQAILNQKMKIKILLIFLLLTFITTRRHLKKDIPQDPPAPKTITQSNHFFSQTNRMASSKISNLEKNKSLIFILKDASENDDKTLKQNPITIELISKQEKAKCQFNSFHNLCSLGKIEENEVELKIECKKTPCELSWKIQQLNTVSIDGKHEIDELIDVNNNYDHAILVAACSDPNVKDLSSQLLLYTNSQYKKIENEASIYYLFDNEKKGQYFVTTESEGIKTCVTTTLTHSQDKIVFGSQKTMIDYILPGKTNSYDLANIPDTDFRMDSYFHIAKKMQMSQKQTIQINLVHEEDKQKKKLQTVNVLGRKAISFDFNVVFKQISKTYKNTAIDVTNNGQSILIISMDFKQSTLQEVSLGQTSFFDLKKGELIHYKLVPLTGQGSEQLKTHIFSSDPQDFVPSLTQCKAKQGCQFTLEAKKDGQGNLYFGYSQTKNTEESIFVDFEDSVTKKIREGEYFLFRKSVKAKKSFKAVVNSKNVLIYASTKQKCPEISQECHQKALNYHNSFIYEPNDDHDLIFKVIGLNYGEFTLRTIDQGTEYIALSDSKPFTYLLDQNERQLKFQFTLEKKEDVFFTLIGPSKELNLFVLNQQKWNEDNKGQGELSTDGYVSFTKDNINSLNFVVKVEKREQFLKKAAHFTLIASTTQANVRLQPGTPLISSIKESQTKDFVFQFQPKKQIILNIYTHNLPKQLDLNMKISTTDEYDKKQGIMSFDLQDSSQVLDLKTVAQQLCKQNMVQNCQLFVRLENKMDIEIQTTLTLMIREAVIELQDGRWNSYKTNQVSKTTHFYFLPQHLNKSVTILYQPDEVDLRIMYSVWKSDDKKINPSQWPFPVQPQTQNNAQNTPYLTYQPTKIVHIDSGALKECWPNCVVLLSVFENKSGIKSKFEGSFIDSSAFKIMASNNYIKVPEKHKIDVILKKDEEKHLLVDLKYVMQKKALTFFTYFTIGSVHLSGNVYDQKNPRCPLAGEDSDFRFGNIQTQISIKRVKQKLQEYSMDEDKRPSLCILVKASQDSKFSIQFDSDDEIITHLRLDTSHLYKGKKDNVKLVQVDASDDFRLKITRNQGFPFIEKKLCKRSQDFQKCLNDFKEDEEKGQQLIDKVKSIKEEPCQKCILFVKITTPEPSVVTLHCQSKYSQTELQQKRLISDQINGSENNKYLVTAVRNEELNINIHIIHGDIEVNVFDFDFVNLTKKNQNGSYHIGITIPPSNQTQKTPLWGSILYSMFSHSSLKSFHIQIKSQNPKVSAMYTISYSSGQPQSYLQDGLITTFFLKPKKTTKFLYKNPNLSSIYLHISCISSQALNKFHIKILSMTDQNDQSTGVEIVPEKVNFTKKTPNPTMIIALPSNKFFQISVENNNRHFQLITLGINDQQIIFLPFNHQFPVQLNKGQHIYLVVNSPFQVFMEVTIKKCGESELTIGYTFDYQDFSKQEFQKEEQMDHDQLVNVWHFKNKKKGAVYLKIQSSPDQISVVTVRANLVFWKNKLERPIAGGKGLINYQLMEVKTARIEFSPLECPQNNSTCYKDFLYSSISSQKIEAVYAQLVCPAIAFDLQDRQILKEGKTSPIHTSKLSNSAISFTQGMTAERQYVGVKAENSKTGEVVYYKPIEISTFWGHVEKASKGNGDIIGIIIALMVIICILIAFRRRKRKLEEYSPLESTD